MKQILLILLLLITQIFIVYFLYTNQINYLIFCVWANIIGYLNAIYFKLKE